MGMFRQSVAITLFEDALGASMGQHPQQYGYPPQLGYPQQQGYPQQYPQQQGYPSGYPGPAYPQNYVA